MAQDIKRKIKLEGEKEYQQALKEAQRNLRVLKSELKAETAELGKNATEQQKAEARTKSLQKQIKEQEKIVQTYKKALEEVKEKYGDDEDAIARWQQKLNDARTTLANMKNDLGGVSDGLKKVEQNSQLSTVAAKSTADAFNSIATVGESISSSIEGIFSGMLERITDLTHQLWQLIAETAEKADAWGDLAGMYGSTAEEVQQLERGLNGAGSDLSSFLSLMNQIEFKGKDSKIAEWLGISDVNYENKVLFTEKALDEMVQKKKELGTSRFNAQLADAFGGRSADIVALVDKWEDAKQMRQEYIDQGYLMSAEEIETMGNVKKQMDDLDEKWDMLKGKFAAGFGQVTMSIMTNVEGALDALAKYFDAETPEDREKALEDLKANIKEAFEKIAEAIREGLKILEEVAEEMKKSDDPVTKALGTILSDVVAALEWFADEQHIELVKKGFETLAAFWLVGKGAQLVSTLAGLAGNLRTISLFRGGSTLAGAAGAGTSTVETSLMATLGTTMGGKIAAVLGGLTLKVGIVAMAVPIIAALSDIVQGKWPDWLPELNKEELDPGNVFSVTKNVELVKKAAKVTSADLREAVRQGVFGGKPKGQEEKEKKDELSGGYLDLLNTILKRQTPEEASDQQKNAAEAYWDEYRTGNVTKETKDTIDMLFGAEERTRLTQRMWQLYVEGEGNGAVPENLPADWWKGSGGGNDNGVTSQDLQKWDSLPKNMKEAVESLIGKMRIELDGQKVADILTPMVSQNIASDID